MGTTTTTNRNTTTNTSITTTTNTNTSLTIIITDTPNTNCNHKENENNILDDLSCDDSTRGSMWSRLSESLLLSNVYDLKTPIVIDNGSAYMKAGFSDMEEPALVIPSVVAT